MTEKPSSEDQGAAPLTGHCLCGAVTIKARPVRPHVEACHCAMCRRWGGSAFLGVQCGPDVEIEGEDHVTRYASSDWAERGFCSQCGSNLFYRFTPADNYSFPAGLFDDLGGATMSEQIFVDEKPDYYDFAQKTVMKTGAEIIAEAEAAGFSFD
ncbi:GFA family protein [Sphingorhabdus sp. M41]|uniref:GFA family protein n=1 Tax=Sphingorhabdus sp. M41 TaxID=1806885 RepID=UPI00078BBB2E|nr:GFA family protein [Sphingorhabdus sp. M41]AMO72059.1 aldehyde-activating protein [Sphingorhabdus sp. M41]